MVPRAGLDTVQKREFFTLLGLELQPKDYTILGDLQYNFIFVTPQVFHFCAAAGTRNIGY
jgi:hypothetical protein